MVNGHPWLLLGPWYRWTQAGVPSAGRASAPALQKFASDDFIAEFLKDPQRSLKFDPDVDQVYAVHFEAAALSGGPLAGKFATLYPYDADGNEKPSRTKLVPTGVRKLFLATHSRHYLVVCELHCDMAGLPTVARDEVCQAGFVVRRKYLSYPESARPFAAKLLRQIVAVQSKLSELDETAPLRPRASRRRAEKMQKMKANGTFLPARQALVDELNEARQALDKWKSANGVISVQQGWIPGEHERIGQWQIVEDEPEEVTEAWFPLYPLVADPTLPEHDAKGRTLYFGVVPTSSFDTDVNGKARFDDQSIYEIRCFVRRHDPHCPRKLEAPDCHGEIVWSRPTERYQLAAQFDLEGTSNRPITIQMPNLAELAAQAVKRPFGKFSPVKFVQPQSLQPRTDGMALSGKSMGGFQICFFSIPLITIVALFVLNIFLPIVVFLFGLWFLLAFKFCIPPSISINAGLNAELDAIGSAGVNVDADFSVNVDFDGDGIAESVRGTAQVNADFKAGVGLDIETANGLPANTVGAELGTFANSPLVDLHSNNDAVAKMPADAKSDPPVGVDYTASLEYEERRTLESAAS
jgi:hypothetical protein